MIAVIVLAGPSPAMHRLDADRSPSLLPLGDRPALQHIIESLVTQDVTSIELIVSHAPEQVEHLLGNGDRWGCNFRYHLVAQPDQPYRSLKIITGLSKEPWVLIHAERYPCVEFAASAANAATLYCGKFVRTPSDDATDLPVPTADGEIWGGTVVMPPTEITDAFASLRYDELCRHLEQKLADGTATAVSTASWLDVSRPAALLQSQADLLDKKLQGLLINGNERQTGVWVSRNANIHPSVQLTPPVYIGSNSRLNRGVRLGPHTVIGSDCIIDSKTSVVNALVTDGSYVGEGLEVHESIIAHNLLVNVRLDTGIDISENFLIGRLERKRRQSPLSRSVHGFTALVLFVALLPLTLGTILYFALFRKKPYTSMRACCIPADDRPPYNLPEFELHCIGADAWSVHRPAGWQAFLRQFLPGLPAVITGNLSLVGLPPRSAEQVKALPDDWRTLYLAGRAGLITEASLAAGPGADEMQLYLADAYYGVQCCFKHDFNLLLKYFARLFRPQKPS